MVRPRLRSSYGSRGTEYLVAAFRYTAFDTSGKRLTGIVDAESRRAARSLLRERGLIPLEATDIRPEGPRRAIWSSSVGKTDLCFLTRQWATLLASGLTMEQCLAGLIGQAENRTLREILSVIRGEIVAGHSLRASLDRFPKQFPLVYRASIAAGERSGELAKVMGNLADYMENRDAARQKVLQAVLYPAIVATVALIVVTILMTYVVPSVVVVFQQSRQALPWLTRALIATSSFLSAWGWLVLIVFAFASVMFGYGLKHETLRRRWHIRLLQLPLCGGYLRSLEAARFANTLSILIASGVPLISALDAGRQVLELLPLKDAVAKAVDGVHEGKTLSAALSETGQFPSLLLHMIANGEATGQLHLMLERAARLQQGQLDHRTAVVTGAMEPLFILAMGGFVLTIVLAVMQPIIEINQFLR
jgi:general secretion pathway protein F